MAPLWKSRKCVRETRKILGREDIEVFPFPVRVPVLNGHSEALVLRFHEQVSLNLASEALCEAPMIRLYPGNEYPNIHDVSGSDNVHVCGVHTDSEDPYVLYAWVAADNLRVGSALNAVVIAECMHERGVV